MKIFTLIVLFIISNIFIAFSQPTIQWQKSLGGGGGDVAQSIEQTTDGGYIVAGFTDSDNGDVSGHYNGDDYWIVKLDIAGSIQWKKIYGGNGDDRAYSIQQTNDGGYIIAGVSGSMDGDVIANHNNSYDYWIVKLNNLGTIEWQKCLGGTGRDEAHSIKQTKDGGYIVAGYSCSLDGDVV